MPLTWVFAGCGLYSALGLICGSTHIMNSVVIRINDPDLHHNNLALELKRDPYVVLYKVQVRLQV